MWHSETPLVPRPVLLSRYYIAGTSRTSQVSSPVLSEKDKSGQVGQVTCYRLMNLSKAKGQIDEVSPQKTCPTYSENLNPPGQVRTGRKSRAINTPSRLSERSGKRERQLKPMFITHMAGFAFPVDFSARMTAKTSPAKG